MIRTWVIACAMALALVPGFVTAEQQSAKVYVFGNSLVHHLSEQAEHTNVPYWMNLMAREDGRELRLDGQWGFMRNFADGLPPTSNWSFDGVRGVWSPNRGGFGTAGFDAVLVTPANFIQYQLPDVPYDGENPSGESPVGAMQRLMDWVHKESPATKLYVYEGWAEMEGVVGRFPPRERGFERYHELNQGEYHQWYEDLINVMQVTRPDYDVTLIPVAKVLAELMARGGPLADVPPEALYEDSAPHGTPTLYFLAAMVTYAWIFEAPPPAGYQPPATLHPDLVSNYAAIAEQIWAATPKFEARAPGTGEGGAAADPLPQRQTVALPPSGLRPEGVPSLGLGLNGISDWSTQHPFLDFMKSARGWVGHTRETWGAVSSAELRAGGHLDTNDWPVSIPDGVTALESVFFTDQSEEQEWLRGDYVLTYEGSGDLEIVGRAKRVRYEPGRITFRYEPGEGLIGLRLEEISATDPIRNIKILKEDHVALYEAGALFNPTFLETIEDARSIRFMDWMITNGSPIGTWEERPTMEVASWSEWGVPVEVMVRLANVIGADPWFNMPHRADDDYVRRFAELVKRDLDPRLQVYVEYSNEVWNQIFPQTVWARERAAEMWGPSDMGWMQFYGLRAAQMMDIWTEIYGPDAEGRLIRVMATHTGWPELEETILKAPLAFLTLGKLPGESFDAYAVTGYFGYEMGTEEMAQRMEAWLDQSEAEATAAGEAQGLRRVALREFVKEVRFEGAIAPVALALQEGSLRQLVEEVFPYHAEAARRHGLQMVMYEGGTHVSGHMEQVNNERLTEFFTTFNYTPEMAKLYEILLGGWASSGGTLFNAFVDVAPATKWGSWGALRHLDDDNPRWDMLMAYNASGPQWDSRPEAVFANGVTVIEGAGQQRLEGTPEEDFLIAGPGDDTIFGGGGGDVIHGGTGRDTVVLPGTQASYSFTQAGNMIFVRSSAGVAQMTSVEVLQFEDAPGDRLETAQLGG